MRVNDTDTLSKLDKGEGRVTWKDPNYAQSRIPSYEQSYRGWSTKLQGITQRERRFSRIN
ncbi:hypothetical protein K443DRAFT_297670 [Laccaria amethystina LaAM-08-1]|uniref:Uncharacterized protein n=1 Tax=Laccaria amethystina LaAM-08-1 TaxID=1095629 RepID=A0A0C9XEF0_9AGAR|nr:hypothetical protein K443DRAFT_297670 [Laccaria amethystina LaAM-08-1]